MLEQVTFKYLLMNVNIEGGIMFIKKILTIGFIILFLSNIIFPVIPGVYNDIDDKNCNYNIIVA